MPREDLHGDIVERERLAVPLADGSGLDQWLNAYVERGTHRGVNRTPLPRTLLRLVPPERRVVDVRLGHEERREQVHLVAVELDDFAVMVGLAELELFAGEGV